MNRTHTRIIAVVGMPGSGKSIASKFFQDQGACVLRFGDQTDIGLTESGLEITEKNERWYRENLRKELGMAAMAIKIEPRILKAAEKSDFIVLDGLYSWEEYIYLHEKFPQMTLLAICASRHLRYRRLATRTTRPLTHAEAESRDIAEIEHLNKGGPIAFADMILVNEGTEENMKSQLEMIVQKYEHRNE